MASIETSIAINRSLEEVFSFITDPGNTPRWAPAVKSVTVSGPMGPGARGREVRTFLGRRLEMDWEVTEYEPPRRLGFRYTSGPLPAVAVFTLEPEAEGTRLTCRTNIQGRGLFRLLGPLIAMEGRGEDQANFQNLKRVLES